VYGHWGNPTAYLVHGWGGWWQQLAAHVEPMVAAGLCVVAMDLPGHGDAGPGRHGRHSTDVVEMAEALAAVVAEFGRPTLVVAHSLGAMASLHALRLGVRPKAYAFLAPPRSAEPMVAAFARALGVGPRSAAVMRRRIEARAGVAIAELDVVSAASEQPSLPSLLVVHDRGDVETSFAGSVEVTTAWHDARLVLTDGLGHRRLLWDPAVVERVTDFAVAAAAEVRRSSR
jgi:pimeloyl-ACP methyl ester carboxylesterase